MGKIGVEQNEKREEIKVAEEKRVVEEKINENDKEINEILAPSGNFS